MDIRAFPYFCLSLCFEYTSVPLLAQIQILVYFIWGGGEESKKKKFLNKSNLCSKTSPLIFQNQKDSICI